jgi:hypothetical protein
VSEEMVKVVGNIAQHVREGMLPGEVYADGEVWAELVALRDWYQQYPNEEPQP